jgi:hypothetical protein
MKMTKCFQILNVLFEIILVILYTVNLIFLIMDHLQITQEYLLEQEI